MGGARCAWPNVVPAWLQSVRALYHDASPEVVSAPRLSARLRASDGAPWLPEEPNKAGKRQCRKRNGCTDSPARAGKGEGGGDNPPCNASAVGLRLAFDVAALRSAAASVANEVRATPPQAPFASVRAPFSSVLTLEAPWPPRHDAHGELGSPVCVSQPVVELELDFEGAKAQAALACWPSAAARQATTGGGQPSGRRLQGQPSRVSFRSRRAGRWRGSDVEQGGSARIRGPRQCTLPLVVEAPSLSPAEQASFVKLHKQCPAYFAPRTTGKASAQLSDWAVLAHMHRRRPIADLCGDQPFRCAAHCADSEEPDASTLHDPVDVMNPLAQILRSGVLAHEPVS
eukprot:4656281-Prymnesium_polylepis.1